VEEVLIFSSQVLAQVVAGGYILVRAEEHRVPGALNSARPMRPNGYDGNANRERHRFAGLTGLQASGKIKFRLKIGLVFEN
jgi:hypothetical protein